MCQCLSVDAACRHVQKAHDQAVLDGRAQSRGEEWIIAVSDPAYAARNHRAAFAQPPPATPNFEDLATGPQILQPDLVKKRGRPSGSARRRSSIEYAASRTHNKCKRCGGLGHNRLTLQVGGCRGGRPVLSVAVCGELPCGGRWLTTYRRMCWVEPDAMRRGLS